MAKEQIKNSARLIVIGGSSGSLDALLVILPLLNKNFSVPIVIVMHRSNTTDSGLTDLLASRTTLQVKEADEKDILRPGCIYVAPPDYHLLLENDGTISLDASEKVNYCRPSIDVTFISAAVAYKKTVIGILLSGANADGAQGMHNIKEYGGMNIVQDPAEALVSFMPEQAILLTAIDQVLPAIEIATLLNSIDR